MQSMDGLTLQQVITRVEWFVEELKKAKIISENDNINCRAIARRNYECVLNLLWKLIAHDIWFTWERSSQLQLSDDKLLCSIPFKWTPEAPPTSKKTDPPSGSTLALFADLEALSSRINGSGVSPTPEACPQPEVEPFPGRDLAKAYNSKIPLRGWEFYPSPDRCILEMVNSHLQKKLQIQIAAIRSNLRVFPSEILELNQFQQKSELQQRQTELQKELGRLCTSYDVKSCQKWMAHAEKVQKKTWKYIRQKMKGRFETVTVPSFLYQVFPGSASHWQQLVFKALRSRDYTAVKDMVLFFRTTHNEVINTEDPSTGNTALHLACRSGHFLLIEWGCDFHAKDSRGQGPLDSIHSERLKEYLLGYSAFWSSAVPAIMHGGADVLYEIVQKHLQDVAGMASLRSRLAMRSFTFKPTEQEELLYGLFQQEIASTLHLAALQTNLTELLALLLGQGADVNKLNDEQCSPLFYAVHVSNFHGAALLLENGAGVMLRDSQGLTAFDYIRSYDEWIESGLFSEEITTLLKAYDLKQTRSLIRGITRKLNVLDARKQLLNSSAWFNLESSHVAACWVKSQPRILLSKSVMLQERLDMNLTSDCNRQHRTGNIMFPKII
ncbi:Ankycorbin [Acipenser ruthenus]|uniref:Ankycorbin n=1 Tax=Acipenser ruthenus TaxID=7906 RepID=A0A662YUE9_ACIRT|nr:Ankycorbin [Acipenser ruthenus]